MIEDEVRLCFNEFESQNDSSYHLKYLCLVKFSNFLHGLCDPTTLISSGKACKIHRSPST